MHVYIIMLLNIQKDVGKGERVEKEGGRNLITVCTLVWNFKILENLSWDWVIFDTNKCRRIPH